MKKSIADIPLLAKEWHPKKNGDLKPNEVSYGAHTRIWWQCSVDNRHEWSSTAGSRGSNNTGCPYCRNKKVDETNSLQTLNPEVAEEWHPTKNKKLTPNDVSFGSRKRVWWQCSKNPEHEWQTAVHQRTGGDRTGCPHCSGASTSQPEIRILCELRQLLGDEEVNWRGRIDGVEADIFLPNHKLAIEYDGNHWHKDKDESDLDKNEFFAKRGITTIRVRHRPLEALSKYDVIVPQKNLSKTDVDELVSRIASLTGLSLDTYANKSSFINDGEFRRYISFLPSPPPEYSLKNEYPDVSAQWDYQKNSPLKPENFSSGSSKKVWWKCPNGEDHEWRTTIHQRTGGDKTGCPFCSNRRVSQTNNLLLNNPELASEWHPTKNGHLTADKVTVVSGKRVWWKCPNGEDHEWVSSVGDRYKGSCPFCTGKRASRDYNLKVLNPKVSEQWHPTKNGELKPENVSPNSSKRVWWQCPESEDHQWESSVASRNNGVGCPFCSGRYASSTNNLLLTHPELAKEWHPTKNGDLTPKDITQGSVKQVWWLCSKSDDHEWESTVNNRTNGTGCPICVGRKVSKKQMKLL